jgi:biotin carboxylase
MKEYIWIIGGSIHQIPAIEEAKSLGLGIVCSDYNKDCIAKKRVDIFVNISIYDKEAHIKEIKRLKKEGINITGIVCIAVDAAITMGAVNDYFGFYGISEEIASICKDKALFRKKMDEWDIENARFDVLTKDDFNNFDLDKLNFPIIVKPNNGFGSIGAKIFYNKEGIKEHLELILKELKFEKALIEEYYVGEEQTVEAIFDYKGNFTPEFITDRFFKKEVYPVEIGLRNPSSLSKKVQDELFSLAKKVGKGLGIKSGTIKLDSILTNKGARIIEATVRVAGGLDPYFLVPAATGKNIMQNAILTALGKPLKEESLLNKKNKIALTGSPLPTPGIIKSIKGIEKAKKLSGVKEVFIFAKVGDRVKEYFDGTSRVCYILVSANNEKEAKEILDEAIKLVEIETQ